MSQSAAETIDTAPAALVIPGRNCAATIAECLSAVVPLLPDQLDEIVIVDDGSTDETAAIVARFEQVRLLRSGGQGPGAARNLGWRSTRSGFVWFIDSDCVARPHALRLLMKQFATGDDCVGAVGGSYANQRPESLLACLIHDEIVARHRTMPAEVDFLATFNVVYRRSVLEEVGGFDEALKLAQDADLAYRVRRTDWELRFEPESLVGHYHADRLWPYLRTQTRQGFYRVQLYRRHPQQVTGDAYSGLVDHLQPPLGVLLLVALPLLLASWLGWLPPQGAWLSALAGSLLFALQLPMTLRLVRQSGRLNRLVFAGLGFVRAIARGIGMTAGVLRLRR